MDHRSILQLMISLSQGTMISCCNTVFEITRTHYGVVNYYGIKLLIYDTLKYRIRTALVEEDETFPNLKRQPIQNLTTRWVCPYFRVPDRGSVNPTPLGGEDDMPNVWKTTK